MKLGRSSALVLCALVSAFGSARAADDYPKHEVWFGAGGAYSFERNIFNVPNGIASTPEVFISLGYIRNLSARRAVGIHILGGFETTPVVLPGAGASPVGPFDLAQGSLGMRYRYTFSRGSPSPYLFVGSNWANGGIESRTGTLDYNGFSMSAGPGASVRMGRHFLLSAEGVGSFGRARWKTKPLPTSTGREFNPSLVGGTVNLSFVWGGEPPSTPAPDTLAIRDSSLASAKRRSSPRAWEIVVVEGCIALLSCPALADDRGKALAGVTTASALLGAAAGGGAQSPKSFKIMLVGLLSLAAAELAIGQAGASEEVLFWTSVVGWNALGYASARADRQAKLKR